MDDGAASVNMLVRAAAGDLRAWGALLMEHEPRLCRMVSFRLHPRLQGRVDPSDVVQEAYLEAAAHREDFFRQTAMPLFLWLRGVVGNKLLESHRHHLGAQMRDAVREVPLHAQGTPDAMSQSLAVQLTGGVTGPGTAAARAEATLHVQQALDRLVPIDREVLALRHFEQLTNGEAAHVLDIQERAAAKRYVRALKRLKDLLAEMPGGLAGLAP